MIINESYFEKFNNKLGSTKLVVLEYTKFDVLERTFSVDPPRAGDGTSETRQNAHNDRLKISARRPKDKTVTITFPIIRDDSTPTGYTIDYDHNDGGKELNKTQKKDILAAAKLIEKYAMKELAACYEDNTSSENQEAFTAAIERMNDNKRKIMNNERKEKNSEL